MRENTGRQTVTTINFADGQAATTEWTRVEADTMQWVIDAYADQHRANLRDGHYIREFGVPFVHEYEEAGLHVTVLGHDNVVDSVFVVEDDDVTRYHTAARTGRTMRIRYAKPNWTGQGPAEVSHREIHVKSVRLSKAGHVIVRALDVRKDEDRSFRADRVTHTTLHRATATVAPSKAVLAAEFQAHTVSTVTATVPAPREALEESASWWLYDTHPGTPAALEAPESVQDKLADAFASGQRYIKVYA